METTMKPKGLEENFSEYGEILFDSYSGETTAWGFKVIKRMGEVEFAEARQHGTMEYVYPDWYLVKKRLTKEEAERKYGEMTEIVRGPRGGFKSVTFGKTRFKTKIEGLG